MRNAKKTYVLDEEGCVVMDRKGRPVTARPPFFKRLFIAAYRLSMLSLLILSATGAAYLRGALPKDIERVPVRVEVEPKRKALNELIEDIAPKYGIDPIIMHAIVERESNGRADAIRFEPSQMGRARKITANPEQQRMYASSHGYAQIMGWWAPEFKLSWSDLYEPRTNIELSCVILKKGLDRHRGKPMRYSERVFLALAEYNGSTSYAQAVMERIGQMLVDRHLDKAI